MKKLFTLLSLFFALCLGAQELPYTLTSWNETYNDLENPILLTDDEVWDDPQFIIPVGFTFEMMGETFEQLLYMDPGVLVMPALSEDSLGILGPYNNDIIDAGYAQDTSLSSISYEVSGNPGSRILKIQWQNVAFYGEFESLGTSNNRTNFQLWLYETTNDIEYRYGNNSIKDPEYVHPFGVPFVFLAKNVNINTGTWEALWLLNGDPANPGNVLYMDPDMEPNPDQLLSGEPASGTVYHFDTGIVSVEEPAAAQTLVVYPTLANTHIMVSLNTPELTPVNIYDATGNLVSALRLTNGIHRVDISELAQGTYLLRRNDASGEYVRFVKN